MSKIFLARKQLEKALCQAGSTTAFFMLDFCTHSNVDDRQSYYWQPHWHGLATFSNYAQAKRELKICYPRAQNIARPIKLKAFDGNPRLLAYIAKFRFPRKLHDCSSGALLSSIHDDDLMVSQRIELMLLLDQLGLTQMLFLHATNFVRGANEALHLMPDNPEL